jgi:hypothetical protein
MFPQPKKIWPSIVAIVAVVFAIKNPEKAADLVNQLISSGTAFLDGLG